MKRKIGFLIVILAIALVSCAPNPYSQFYYDSTGGVDLSLAPNVILSNESPILYSGKNLDSDGLFMLENNFAAIGYSSFNGGDIGADQALEQARAVRAAAVIVYSQYTNTVSGTVPLTLPDTQYSTSSTSGSLYGSSGYLNYYGTTNTTTYGTRTTYIPYTVNRYDYFATYWVKMRNPIFGTHIRDLSAQERQLIGSNKGVVVIAVIKNSPAFSADVLRNDILKRIGNIEIVDALSFSTALAQYAGQEVEVEILRNNNVIQKSVRLNSVS